MLTEERHRLVD